MKGTRTTTPPSPEIKHRPPAPERKRRTITGKEQHRAKRLRSDNRELKTEGFEKVVPSVSEWEPWWLRRFWAEEHVKETIEKLQATAVIAAPAPPLQAALPQQTAAPALSSQPPQLTTEEEAFLITNVILTNEDYVEQWNESSPLEGNFSNLFDGL